MNEMKMGVYTKGNESYNFNFYTDISAAKKLKFVNSVIDLVVDDTHYNSVIRDIVFDYYVISIMTDIDVKEFEKSLNFLDDVEQFLYDTNIVKIVRANAFPTLFDELNDAVDKSIQYLTGIHPSPIADSLASLLSTLEKKINEFDMDNTMEMVQKFAGMTDEFNLESLVNAYINSDIHQKNVVEIEEAKKQRVEIAENLDNAIKSVKDDTNKNPKNQRSN